jgi:hypothetical protein
LNRAWTRHDCGRQETVMILLNTSSLLACDAPLMSPSRTFIATLTSHKAPSFGSAVVPSNHSRNTSRCREGLRREDVLLSPLW